MKENGIVRLEIQKIILDPELQPRNELIASNILQYSNDMKAGDEFPPVEVMRIKGKLYLISGWHRVLAAKKAKIAHVMAQIKEGDYEDALWESAAANLEFDKSGGRRTNQDKQKAIKMALKAKVHSGAKIVYAQIANHVGVDEKTVSKWYRKEYPSENIHNSGNSGIVNNVINETDPRRTNADKRRVITGILKHEKWGQLPDHEIAKRYRVSPQLVSKLRASLESPAEPEPPQPIPVAISEAQHPIEREKYIDYWKHKRLETHRRLEETSWEDQEIKKIQEEIKTERTEKLNKVNEKIEWAAWSWNPVTGCLHGCAYCYARDIANRFYPEGFQPSFHPKRLEAPDNTNIPLEPRFIGDRGYKNIFTCSMADLFGKWIPREWIDAVLETIERNPQWTFLLLSKFPDKMAEFSYPPNVWLGASVDYQWSVERAEKAFLKIKASGFSGVCWLSCEPMMERLTFNSLDMFDWVVVGGASKSSQTPEYVPPFEDIIHLHNQARRSGCKIYQKTNLIPGMSDRQRIREYPAEEREDTP